MTDPHRTAETIPGCRQFHRGVKGWSTDISTQQHYLPLFVGDFLASTATWTGPERGLYLQLLAFQWTAGFLPCEIARLARAVNYERKEFEALWPVMKDKFSNGDGRLMNARLEAIRAKTLEMQAAKAAKARHASNARWNAPSIPSSNAQAKPGAMPTDDTSICSTMLSVPIRSNPIQSEPNRTEDTPPQGGGSAEGEMPRGKRAARATRIPADFALTPEREAYARTHGADPKQTFEMFVTYWRAKSGAGATKADWESTWQHWCLKEQKSNQPKKTRFDQIMEMRRGNEE